MKQSVEICEIAFWQKFRKTGQAHFKSPGLPPSNSSRSGLKIFAEAPPKSKASYGTWDFRKMFRTNLIIWQLGKRTSGKLKFRRTGFVAKSGSKI